MPFFRPNPCRLLAAAVLGAGAANAFAQPASTRPAATLPAADVGADGAADVDDLWDEPDEPAVLATAAAVRALTPEQAATARPVRIRGVVTYLAAVPPLLFVQDATGGVCVTGVRDRELRTQIKYGSVIQVEGVTARGGDVATVASPDAGPLRIEILSAGRVPAPRLATVAQLAAGSLHGDLVEVEGVVRAVRTERIAATGPGATVLTLAHAGGRADALILGRAGETIVPEVYVGAVVRARGVFNAAAPTRFEVVARRLLLRTVRDLRVRTPAVPAQDIPVAVIRGLADLATSPPTGEPSGAARSRVQGVVTLVLAGRGMFVQDTGGGVWVDAPPGDDPSGGGDTNPPAAAGVGDGVDVVGFPGRRGWSTVLADASWRVTGKAPMPDAPLVTAEQALAPEMDARLVRLDALVLSVSRISQHTTLVLQSGSRVFLARLADSAARPPPGVGEGSWVRLSGVCVQTPLEGSWTGGGGATTRSAEAEPGSRPPSFYLILPSGQAVQVIRAPGWWTLRRVLVVCGVLAAVALASIAWVLALRRRVARQTGVIRDHLARRSLYEERVRIARDLHDSLEQDLLGITMQLNATEKLLAHPERARQSLHLAAAMVRRSQAETHRAVWDLREQRAGPDGLVSAIREAVAGLAAPRAAAGANGAGGATDSPDVVHNGPRVEVRGVGDARALPPQVENHLLRAALEAVTNAVKHAAATRIDVEVRFDPDRVEVKVADDGRGFDAERLPPPSSGHFGLFGMRERAEKLGGQLTLRSRPGGGSEVRLAVPLPQPLSNYIAPTPHPAASP